MYFPPEKPQAPEKCPGCGKWYVTDGSSRSRVSCCVVHAPGTCCHYGEIEVTAEGVPVHPPGLRRFVIA